MRNLDYGGHIVRLLKMDNRITAVPTALQLLSLQTKNNVKIGRNFLETSGKYLYVHCTAE